ncbi:MAG: hypothetical protein ACIAZJ_18120 [Gimesia chilikensis]|uniref:hypothetical protein n=1 Tax=Gimesia chilikensis TaxID=2605989 RepID=UPI0037A7F518
MIHFRSVFLTMLMILLVDNAALLADAEKKYEPQLKITEPRLDNSDVEWEGNFFGFFPRISWRAARFSKHISPEDKNWLLKNLKHKDRTAICHLLLIEYWGPPAAEGEIKHSLSAWYGLTAELQASGEIRYDEADREKLFKLWTKVLSDPKNRFKHGKGFLLDPFKRKKKQEVDDQ